MTLGKTNKVSLWRLLAPLLGNPHPVGASENRTRRTAFLAPRQLVDRCRPAGDEAASWGTLAEWPPPAFLIVYMA